MKQPRTTQQRTTRLQTLAVRRGIARKACAVARDLGSCLGETADIDVPCWDSGDVWLTRYSYERDGLRIEAVHRAYEDARTAHCSSSTAIHCAGVLVFEGGEHPSSITCYLPGPSWERTLERAYRTIGLQAPTATTAVPR